MNPLILTLMAGVLIWMALCAWCGFRKRFMRFGGVLVGGLAINQLWMMIGLHANALEPNLLVAQAAAVCYAVFAFGCGYLAGRVARQWQASRVEDAGV